MTVKNTALPVLLTLCLFAPSALATVTVDLVDPFTGDDSGWSVILADDVHNGVIVDKVGSSYVRIEIAKEFYHRPICGDTFIANFIVFKQRLWDADTAPTIQITDEIIRNETGVAWFDYHWKIIGRMAAFDKEATDDSGFSIDPFTNSEWGSTQHGWDGDHARSLGVDGGVVPDGELFQPGSRSGKLYIDTNLSTCSRSFVLMQYPSVPEPGAAVLLVSGGVVALIRRRR